METSEYQNLVALNAAKRFFQIERPSSHASSNPVNTRTGGGELVSFLFQTVVSPKANVSHEPLGVELGGIRKVTVAIIEAVENGSLTETEGNTVINFLAERFASRQVARVFEHMAESSRLGWFALERKALHG